MIFDVSKRDVAAWIKHGRMIGRALKQEIDSAPAAAVMKKALAEQVRLNYRLPRGSERVHRLTLRGLLNGTRASEIAEEIMKSGEVTKPALLIARPK